MGEHVPVTPPNNFPKKLSKTWKLFGVFSGD